MIVTTQSERSTKLWHDLVNRSLDKHLASGKPFSISDVLRSCGLFEWASTRARAEAYATARYATKMLQTQRPQTHATKGKQP